VPATLADGMTRPIINIIIVSNAIRVTIAINASIVIIIIWIEIATIMSH
jgi:hypothetical protein